MSSVLRPLTVAAIVGAAIVFLTPGMRAISPEAAAVQLQMAKLLFSDGRYMEAFDAFEQAKPSQDPRIRREALAGCVTAALRLGDFSHAYADAQTLMKTGVKDAYSVALFGDALWSVGLFEQSEKTFAEATALEPGNPRALHGLARGLAARNKFTEANKDRSAKAAWARAEVRFLRAFGTKVPLQIDPASAGKLHNIPFRVVNEKVIVRGKVNRGPMMDFVLDTGSEQTVVSKETAARLGIRPMVNILSAGVGDLGVRELELTRLDSLEIGSLKVHNVPAIIKNPPLQGLPTREMESFSPLAFGLSLVIDYDKLLLQMGPEIPNDPVDVELPLRLHRLAMVPGHVQGGPASFILDTGGQVISISTDTASGLERGEMRNIPLKVYGASGWDRDAFLMPGVELAFNKIQYHNLSVVVLNLRAPSVLLGFRLGGIVGYKFLSRYKVAINLDKSVVQLKQRIPSRAN
jgi:predicted aspartyl protease